MPSNLAPEFASTPAVAKARRRDQFIPCPACASDSQRYLFHQVGARFVQCRACGLVYADPVDAAERSYFDIETTGQHAEAIDLLHAVSDFRTMLQKVESHYERHYHRRPRRVLLLGRWHRDFLDAVRGQYDLEVLQARGDEEASLVRRPLVDSVGPRLRDFDILLLNEFLEAAPDSALVLTALAGQLHGDAMVAVAFANMRAFASRGLRRRWKGFFNSKVAFYDAENLKNLMWRQGFRRLGTERLPTTYSLGYLARRLDLPNTTRRGLELSRAASLSFRAASGREVALFRPAPSTPPDKLTIIVPVYNEARYVGDVLERLLAKELPLEREIIVVESNSTDNSREIVRSFEGRQGLYVLYQSRPSGKGNAVRAALERASGTILLIQDADFEYDVDDYDALLEPLLLRRTSFVLGSRSLGLDDWKVRQYESSRVKAMLMNLAQVAFAQTFNVLYQQRVTDINTMLKVFRRECIEGCSLDGDGFNFDIELVCKIVRNGFEPYEVPVNYVGRSFAEGKKINFLVDAFPSYYQLFKCRLGQR